MVGKGDQVMDSVMTMMMMMMIVRERRERGCFAHYSTPTQAWKKWSASDGTIREKARRCVAKARSMYSDFPSEEGPTQKETHTHVSVCLTRPTRTR